MLDHVNTTDTDSSDMCGVVSGTIVIHGNDTEAATAQDDIRHNTVDSGSSQAPGHGNFFCYKILLRGNMYHFRRSKRS